MNIPDSIDSIFLTEETLLEVSHRTGLTIDQLAVQLGKDRENGTQSCYVFSIYSPSRKTDKGDNDTRKGVIMDKIQQLWREKPLELIASVGTVAIVASKVAESIASTRSKNAYAKQVKARTSKKK